MLVLSSDGVSNNDIINLVFGTILLVCSITALVKRQLYSILYFLQFLVWSPVMYIILPIYCIWHSDDFGWGKTRQVMKAAAAAQTELPCWTLKEDVTDWQGESGPTVLDNRVNVSMENDHNTSWIVNVSATKILSVTRDERKTSNSTMTFQESFTKGSLEMCSSGQYSDNYLKYDTNESDRSLSITKDDPSPRYDSMTSLTCTSSSGISVKSKNSIKDPNPLDADKTIKTKNDQSAPSESKESVDSGIAMQCHANGINQETGFRGSAYFDPKDLCNAHSIESKCFSLFQDAGIERRFTQTVDDLDFLKVIKDFTEYGRKSIDNLSNLSQEENDSRLCLRSSASSSSVVEWISLGTALKVTVT